LSIFPYYWIGGRTLYWIRFVRYFQVFETQRILQNFWEKLLLRLTSNIRFVKSYTGIINFAFLLMLVAQLLSSIWYFCGTLGPIEEGSTSNDIKSGWITAMGYNGSDTNTLYITSLYWVFTTLSTVGYGDIYGSLTDEYLYNMAVEFIGVFLFAYMMSNINTFIIQLDNNNSEIMEKNTEELDQWIMKIDRANPPTKKLEESMVKEINEFFQTYWQKDHTMINTDDNFLNQLPRDLKAKLIDHLFGKFIKKFEVFFAGTEPAFQHEVVINLFPRKFPAKTNIIEIDTGAKDIYFIIKGNVTICSKDGVETYVILPTHSYFGDHLILFNLKSSNAFRAHDEEVECMCLNRDKFIELCDEYPESIKVLKYKAYLRRKYFRQMKLEVTNKDKSNSQGGQGAEVNFLDELMESNQVSDLQNRGPEASPEETARLLDKARKIKNALDRAETVLNNMEEEFSRKIKNIKFYIGYISNMEDAQN